ncbi:MAG: cobalamin-dependent protein [Dehalococcoidia bacterium]
MPKTDDRRTIILFHPRTLHERNYRYFYVPYSVLSVASTLARAEYRVLVVDNNVENLDEFGSVLRDVADDLLCVGISSMIGHQIRDGLRFARAVRELDAAIPIVWGGALPTVLPEETIAHPDVDIIVQGQGQATFRDLVDCLAQDRDLSQVPGIS